MGAAEELVRLEAEVEAVAIVLIPAVGAGFEARTDVVVDPAFVFDHGDREAVVAHAVGIEEEEFAVGLGHDDAQVVTQTGGVFEAIFDFIEGTASSSFRGEE